MRWSGACTTSLSAVKRTLESGRIVPGGGAVETALHIYLEEWATSVVSFIHHAPTPAHTDSSR